MGVPSLSILLHEIIKLMYHAKVKDPIFFRIGTCGGVGVEPGSVVVTEEAVDELLKPFYEVVSLQLELARIFYPRKKISCGVSNQHHSHLHPLEVSTKFR